MWKEKEKICKMIFGVFQIKLPKILLRFLLVGLRGETKAWFEPTGNQLYWQNNL